MKRTYLLLSDSKLLLENLNLAHDYYKFLIKRKYSSVDPTQLPPILQNGGFLIIHLCCAGKPHYPFLKSVKKQPKYFNQAIKPTHSV
jgi:hypothetical protein